jgi:hypothetical protein
VNVTQRCSGRSSRALRGRCGVSEAAQHAFSHVRWSHMSLSLVKRHTSRAEPQRAAQAPHGAELPPVAAMKENGTAPAAHTEGGVHGMRRQRAMPATSNAHPTHTCMPPMPANRRLMHTCTPQTRCVMHAHNSAPRLIHASVHAARAQHVPPGPQAPAMPLLSSSLTPLQRRACPQAAAPARCTSCQINWSYRERREGRRPATPISREYSRYFFVFC